nr:hypothetical protein [uncultured Oscillibacter sp.]
MNEINAAYEQMRNSSRNNSAYGYSSPSGNGSASSAASGYRPPDDDPFGWQRVVWEFHPVRPGRLIWLLVAGILAMNLLAMSFRPKATERSAMWPGYREEQTVPDLRGFYPPGFEQDGDTAEEQPDSETPENPQPESPQIPFPRGVPRGAAPNR